MKLVEAISDMKRLAAMTDASPPEIQCLVRFALIEIDRQRFARRNPTLAAMREAVPDSLVRDLVADQRRGVSSPSSLAELRDQKRDQPRRGTGWQQDTGFRDRSRDFELMDRIVESQVGGPNDTRRLR